MIVTALSWIWIGISALLWGIAVLVLLNRIEQNTYSTVYVAVILGLAALTVFSEVFSLFSGVGLSANIVVLSVDIMVAVAMRRKINQQVKDWYSSAGTVRIILILIIGALVCLLTAMVVTNGDSYLYHQQAIHWIYEYGAVKGLGNLHTRFAFNSAFLCLQALFSVPFATGGISLHSLNGFISWIFLSYAVCSMRIFREKKVFVSDFARLGMLIYLATEYAAFSSPGTDIFALGLASFILCEWITFTEYKCKDSFPYALLCILIVFDITLKLSTAMLIILLIYPAYLLIKQRKWREIALYLIAGIAAVMPFFARNYVISGWLVYPFDKIDIFNVDWKVPKGTLSTECSRTLRGSREIYMAGLGTEAPFSEWFPYWYAVNGKSAVAMCVAAAVAMIISIPTALMRICRERDFHFAHMIFTLTAGLFYWYISAPMIRYGKPFMIVLPCYLIGVIVYDVFCVKKIETSSRAIRLLSVALASFMLCGTIPMLKYARYERVILNKPYDYFHCAVTEYNFCGLPIYIPDTYGRMSYYTFPCIQYESCLDIIELRGDDYSDGFRALPGIDDII